MGVSDAVLVALGDGWLGKVLLAGGGVAAGWFAKRPAQHAALMMAVDARVGTLLTHMEKEVERACKRCDEMAEDLALERARCDQELSDMRAEIDRHMARPPAGYPTITIHPVRPKRGG